MTTTYKKRTEEVGSQWIAALQSVEDAVLAYWSSVQSVQDRFPSPPADYADQLSSIKQAIAEQYPKPEEVVEADFALASRLLTAHRDFALKLVAAGPGLPETADQVPPASRARQTKPREA